MKYTWILLASITFLLGTFIRAEEESPPPFGSVPFKDLFKERCRYEVPVHLKYLKAHFFHGAGQKRGSLYVYGKDPTTREQKILRASGCDSTQTNVTKFEDITNRLFPKGAHELYLIGSRPKLGHLAVAYEIEQDGRYVPYLQLFDGYTLTKLQGDLGEPIEIPRSDDHDLWVLSIAPLPDHRWLLGAQRVRELNEDPSRYSPRDVRFLHIFAENRPGEFVASFLSPPDEALKKCTLQGALKTALYSDGMDAIPFGENILAVNTYIPKVQEYAPDGKWLSEIGYELPGYIGYDDDPDGDGTTIIDECDSWDQSQMFDERKIFDMVNQWTPAKRIFSLHSPEKSYFMKGSLQEKSFFRDGVAKGDYDWAMEVYGIGDSGYDRIVITSVKDCEPMATSGMSMVCADRYPATAEKKVGSFVYEYELDLAGGRIAKRVGRRDTNWYKRRPKQVDAGQINIAKLIPSEVTFLQNHRKTALVYVEEIEGCVTKFRDRGESAWLDSRKEGDERQLWLVLHSKLSEDRQLELAKIFRNSSFSAEVRVTNNDQLIALLEEISEN